MANRRAWRRSGWFLRSPQTLALLGKVAVKISLAALGGITVLIATAVPTFGAERVKLQFGVFSRSVPMSSLDAFAQDGTIDDHLRGLFRHLSPETLTQIRLVLTTAYPEDPLVFSQTLRTPMATRLLQATGLTVQTGAGLNGQVALRSALNTAVAEPDGLSLINTLRNFPTEVVTIDLVRVLTVKRRVDQAIQDTNGFMTAVETEATAAALASPVDYAAQPDLRERGPYPVRFMPLNLVDQTRNRAVPADLFLPEIPNATAGSIPIVVFSHGLGHSRIYFRDVAEHLATYGFAVAMPEHVGSNEGQQQALESWLTDEFFQRREFVNRPLDVSFLLDELTRLNATEFNHQLNPELVGAIGHSFGGYTVLATAGATVDFAWLHHQCGPDAEFVSNISRLLQCRALELETSPDDVALLSQGGLRDPRIKLVMAFNTVSNLFGETGTANIQIPTLIAGGRYDFITPVIPEQIDTFRWLTTPDKYFLLVDQKAHGEGSTLTFMQFVYPIEDTLEIQLSQQWLRSNYSALLVAFAKVYLANQVEYRSYLESAYANYISVAPFTLHLVQDLPDYGD